MNTEESVITPAQALKWLKAGNLRFIQGEHTPKDYHNKIKQTANEQRPFAAVLGCIDSRVPHEIVFDQNLGHIFSIRIAGNFADNSILGSLEFATYCAGAKIILVLGHTDCGAVKGACDNITLGHLTQTLQHLSPALKATTGFSESMQNSANLAYVMQVTRYNVQLTVTKILNESPVLRELVEKQKLMVVAGIYNTSTGKVDFL